MTTHNDAEHNGEPEHKAKHKVKHKPSSVFAVRGTVPAHEGPISVPGLEVGDMVLGILVESGHWLQAGQSSGFEPVISVADEVQHTGDHGPNDVFFVIVRVPDGDK